MHNLTLKEKHIFILKDLQRKTGCLSLIKDMLIRDKVMTEQEYSNAINQHKDTAKALEYILEQALLNDKIQSMLYTWKILPEYETSITIVTHNSFNIYG
jgi:hypothetical protein